MSENTKDEVIDRIRTNAVKAFTNGDYEQQTGIMSTKNPGTSTDTPKEKPLTREQRRRHDRTNAEAISTIETLQAQFLNFFMASEETEGDAVSDKIREIDAKWRLYCKRKNLVPAAYPVMDKYMEDSIKEYYSNKEHQKQVETEFKPDSIEENATDTKTN
jgi:hypothetical protein